MISMCPIFLIFLIYFSYFSFELPVLAAAPDMFLCFLFPHDTLIHSLFSYVILCITTRISIVSFLNVSSYNISFIRLSKLLSVLFLGIFNSLWCLSYTSYWLCLFFLVTFYLVRTLFFQNLLLLFTIFFYNYLSSLQLQTAPPTFTYTSPRIPMVLPTLY